MAAGCNAILGIDDLSLRDGGAGRDAVLDGAAFCYGTLVPTCFPMAPTGGLTLTGPLDTTSDARCSPGPICAIGADNLVIDRLDVTGKRPLALVAITTLTVAGQLDASSTQNRTGPASGSVACTVPSPAGGGGNPGGGAGASFGTVGGTGGKGATGGGAAGGIPGAIQQPTELRGGCPGAPGGGAAGTFGTGGNGGGALALYAGTKIQIDQDIRVVGAGGRGGITAGGGGGGGGSGGMIVLEAPMIVALNDVYANGGGGGEGANGNDDGETGKESTAFDGVAAGGNNSGGGNGGAGFAGTMAAGPGATAGGGAGGGGGGGGGVIWIKGTLTGTKISPAPIPR